VKVNISARNSCNCSKPGSLPARHFPADEQPPADPATWWSYKAPHSPPIPEVNQKPWVRNPIDAFISQQHDNKGLQPSPEARPEVLLRRLYLDLIGIPPTRAELHAWLADADPQRYEKTVDQLLNRPEYGQRWGQHWMDVWRYSDWYGSRGINEIRYSQRHICALAGLDRGITQCRQTL
jgi:hypothetical protein